MKALCEMRSGPQENSDGIRLLQALEIDFLPKVVSSNGAETD